MLELTAGWPLLATPVSAGFPSPAADDVERRLSLDEHLIRHPESTFLMRVSGDELWEMGVHDGDLLVVDRATPATTDSLVVAVVDGQFCLARLNRDHQGRRVVQFAQAHTPDRPLGDGHDLQIWGVARWAVHRLWPGRLPSA